MLTAKVPLKQAQIVKKFLIKNKLFNLDYQPKKDNNYLYFPLSKNFKKQAYKDIATIDKKLLKVEKQVTVDQLLKNKLTKRQRGLVPSAQEVVGSILVLEIPKELEKKEKIVAEAFLKANKNIKTVVKKSLVHGGVFRLRKVKLLAGERTKETIHRENGIRLKLDLEKTYFSARLANERARIAKQVRKGEEVLVMFSGAAPYPLVLARNSPVKSIVGIEINPLAHQMALENIQLNKLEHKIKVLEGDVNKILPRIKKKFDRIVMPLPKTGELFLPLALKKSKIGTTIHLYAFLDETKIDQEAKKIKELCHQAKCNTKILRKVLCGQFAPYVFRICFDIKIIK